MERLAEENLSERLERGANWRSLGVDQGADQTGQYAFQSMFDSAQKYMRVTDIILALKVEDTRVSHMDCRED